MAAIHTLRSLGFDGRVVLVGEEELLPYERPPLSKQFLTDRDSLPDGPPGPRFPLDESWYRDGEVDLLLGRRATGLDVGGRRLILSSGEHIEYDTVLLATGSAPVEPFPPSERVRYLRTFGDAVGLRELMGAIAHLAVVGGGFIGCEVASAGRALGAEVTMIEAMELPLEMQLGAGMGAVVERIHRDAGVRVVVGEPVRSVVERDAGVVVGTSSGTLFEADAAVVALGARPRVELALAARLPIDGGIAVDQYLRAAPGVLAAGDVASHLHPLFGKRLRVEHYDNALKQGAAAARAVLGDARPHSDPLWFWSDQHGCRIETAGLPASGDVVVRGSVANLDFVEFRLVDGRITGAASVNRSRDMRRVRRLIAARSRPSPEDLADEDVPLETLLERSGR
jgi:3-phenylpropionate/trans-cinnamate dioxygenase ferredoxin reductase subunit